MKKNILTFPLTKIINSEGIVWGDNIIIDDFTFISVKKTLSIGSNVHISCFSSIVGSEDITIGDFAAISHGCRIFSSSDDFIDWGFGNPTVPVEYRNVKDKKVSIGKFCIIGANSVVLPGVTIGEGTTVGANSVVTRDLEPWGVYLGNKRIKERNRKSVEKNFTRYLNNKK